LDPYDQTIKTANFPILSSIVGAAFGGASPFQAEIYFMNLSGNIQVKFGIPYFDVFDPRFMDFAVPMSARGTITFNVTDYKGFIKLNRLINFELEDFNKQIKML
jgi:membrane protease subunit (stomatin/prohibitin family)